MEKIEHAFNNEALKEHDNKIRKETVEAIKGLIEKNFVCGYVSDSFGSPIHSKMCRKCSLIKEIKKKFYGDLEDGN